MYLQRRAAQRQAELAEQLLQEHDLNLQEAEQAELEAGRTVSAAQVQTRIFTAGLRAIDGQKVEAAIQQFNDDASKSGADLQIDGAFQVFLGQEISNWERYLMSLDAQEGTTHRTEKIQEVNRRIAEARVKGSQNAMNGGNAINFNSL